MIIVKQDVMNFATELAGAVLNDGMWADVLAYVNQIDLNTLDTDIDRRLARILFAAHIATVTKIRGTAGGGEAAGPVISESVGGVRRAYATITTTSTGDGSLSTTRYGQMFAQMLRASNAGPMVC